MLTLRSGSKNVQQLHLLVKQSLTNVCIVDNCSQRWLRRSVATVTVMVHVYSSGLPWSSSNWKKTSELGQGGLKRLAVVIWEWCKSASGIICDRRWRRVRSLSHLETSKQNKAYRRVNLLTTVSTAVRAAAVTGAECEWMRRLHKCVKWSWLSLNHRRPISPPPAL